MRNDTGLAICRSLIQLSLFFVSSPSSGQMSLEIPPDARTEAMGRAFSVLDRGASSAWGNVGGLAFVSGFEAVGSRARLFPNFSDDITLLFGSAAYGFRVAGKKITLSANAARLRVPPQTYHCTADYNDAVLGGAIAHRISPVLGVGIGVKRVRQSYSGGMGEGLLGSFCNRDEILASGPAVDLGVLSLIPVSREADGRASLNLLGGLSLRNLGPDLNLEFEKPTPLPWRIVAGAGVTWRSEPAGMSAARWLGPPDARLMSISAGVSVSTATLREVAKDLQDHQYEEKRLTDGQWGGELRLLDILSLRAGYLNDAVNDAHGGTSGAGIAVRDKAGFDIARIPQRDGLRGVTKISFWLHAPIGGGSSQ